MQAHLVVALLVMYVGITDAHADAKCRAQERTLASGLTALNDVASKATTATVTCTFRGTDDKLVLKLADDAVKAFRLMSVAATTSGCTRRNPEVLLGAVSRWVGERLGFLYATCSSEAQRIVEAYPDSEESRKTAMAPLTERYIANILKRAGISP